MSVSDAFLTLLGMSKKTMQIRRISGTPIAAINIQVSPANYHRNLATLEAVQVKGYEFVISTNEIVRVGFVTIKRGDILIDPVMGNLTISEVNPMFIFGNLVGYRVRTS